MAESWVHKMPRPVGRPHRFSKPEDLWDKFVEYCDYIDSNPWQVKSASNSIDSHSEKTANAMRQDVRVMQRAYTLFGFCAYAGISSKWADFKRTNIERRGFKEVIVQIENVVCAQQVDGAMINQFNGSLVARLNGIAEYQITEINGDFKLPKFTAEDIEELKRINGL